MADLNVYLNKLYDSLVHFKLMQCCPVYNNTGIAPSLQSPVVGSPQSS